MPNLLTGFVAGGCFWRHLRRGGRWAFDGNNLTGFVMKFDNQGSYLWTAQDANREVGFLEVPGVAQWLFRDVIWWFRYRLQMVMERMFFSQPLGSV